jgi:hypothetical protein
MEFRNTAGRELEGSPVGRGERISRRQNLFGADANSAWLKVYPVKAPGQGQQRTVASAPHLGDNSRHCVIDPLPVRIPRPHQEFEKPLKLGRAEM